MSSEMGGVEVSRETQMSIEVSSMFPGFRFSPTDVELITCYLKKKMEGDGKCVEIIPHVEICKHEPWDLPAKSIVQSETEWFFFSPRGKKYPNGSQSKRATELGYWKATGKEHNVYSGSAVIGTKRTLVFHLGRAPKGERTEWLMHEYCMQSCSQDALVVCRLRRNVDSPGHRSNNSPSERPKFKEANAAVTSKNRNSSPDSYSTEHSNELDRYKQPNMATPATVESSSRHNHDLQSLDDSYHSLGFSDYEFDEDFFADILKDEIVKLDDIERTPPPEGNRRMQEVDDAAVGEGEEEAERERVSKEKEDEEAEMERLTKEKKLPHCVVGVVMFVRRKGGNQVALLFVVTVLAIAGVLALLGCLLGKVQGSERVGKFFHLPAIALNMAH